MKKMTAARDGSGFCQGRPSRARWLGAGLALAWLAAAACGSSEDATALTPPASGDTQRSGSAPGGTGTADSPDCFEHPTTHVEIINACTPALRVTRTPELTLLEPDGSLPPL